MASARSSVRAIKHSEAHGDYQTVSKLLRYYGDSIENSQDTEAKIEYRNIVARIQPFIEYEKVYGVGSFLELDRPLTRYKISIGLITNEQVESALRHRARGLFRSSALRGGVLPKLAVTAISLTPSNVECLSLNISPAMLQENGQHHCHDLTGGLLKAGRFPSRCSTFDRLDCRSRERVSQNRSGCSVRERRGKIDPQNNR